MNQHQDIKDGENAADMLLRIMKELAMELHPRRKMARPVTLDSSISHDLGLDSLARIELLARIGKSFGVTLPERVFMDVETPRDLLRAIVSADPLNAASSAPDMRVLELEKTLSAPHSAQTLNDVINWHVQTHRDRPHIRFCTDEGEDDILTYGQLREGAAALAARLQHHGLQRGEPVAIMLPTGKDYFFAYLGILLAGGVPVPIYPPARRSQIEDHLRRHSAILKNCGAAIMIIMPEAKFVGQMLKSQVENLRSLMTVEELMSGPGMYQEPQLGSHDIAFLQYTSGSTGNPKGVILSHANLLANIRAIGVAVQISSADVIVSWLPLYHDMGLIGAWMSSLYYGSLFVLMSPLSFISQPQRWLWAIHRYGGTISAAPNFAYELCLKRIGEENLKGLNLASWRIACNGAEPVSPDTIENFCRKFGAYGFRRETMMPVYGLAECSVGLTFPPLDRGPLIDKIQREPFVSGGEAVPADDGDTKALQFVACGRPLPGHDIRILDPSGRELPERREGRLQFRGPSATSGYFHNAMDTGNLFHGDWLETGDMAYIAGSDLFITGRKKDIIIRAGRNIYPQELEEAIGGLAGIRKGNVVVFGIADSAAGTEQLIVAAETKETAPERLDKIVQDIHALAIDLTGAAADDVILTPPGTILKTSSGKIRRAGNRLLYEQGQMGKGSTATWLQIGRIAMAGLLPEFRRMVHRFSEGLFAVWCWSLFWLLAPLTWLSVIVMPRFSWRWSLMGKAARLLARATFTPLIVQGTEHLPRDRTYILVANHTSYLDSFIAAASIPLEFRFVAKSELAKGFAGRLFLKRIQTEFVERFDMQKGVEDSRRIIQSARKGRSLFFFAEGTFTRVPGLRPFHMGAFLAAAEADVPVVPIAIRGARSILLEDTRFPRRGKIIVTIGDPIETSNLRDPETTDLWMTALKLRDLSHDHILRYCGEPDLSSDHAPL
jgi:1-acyl-sn-glycerol-3-phosphate acyltransferase